MDNKNSEAPLCMCGCKNQVTWNERKKKWNIYIHGHNKPTQKCIPNEEGPLCKCGCGKSVKWSKKHNRWNEYIDHHNNRKLTFFAENRGEPPLCACGCGEKVEWCKHNSKWNIYIYGHQSRNSSYNERINIEQPLCACGCGEKVIWSKSECRWNTYIRGHAVRNESEEAKNKRVTALRKAVKTPEHHDKLSEVSKKRWQDPNYRENQSIKAVESWKNEDIRRRRTGGIIKKVQTKEHREKQQKISLENWKDPKVRENRTKWLEDEENIKNLSNKAKEQWSDEELLKRMRPFWDSKERSDEIKQRLTEHYKDPRSREKLSACTKKQWEENTAYRERMTGENSPSWRGGISCEPYCKEWTFEEFKDMVRERDEWKCQNPDCWGKVFNEKLTIHHIDYNKKNCHPLNLITVCRSCNARANVKREYWQKFYEKIMNKRFEENGLTLK